MNKIENCYNFKKYEGDKYKNVKKHFKSIINNSFLVSLYNITISLKEYSDSRKVYQEIRENKGEIYLYNINSDYMEWINIKNTPIDYPIIKGDNNEIYLQMIQSVFLLILIKRKILINI
ncbi:MAG: hypothetical protein ACLR60_05715 [Clostridium paraputrificum]